MPRSKSKPDDEFRNWTVHALLWIKSNWKGALELTGFAVIIFAIVFGATSYWHSRSDSAAMDLYAASRTSKDATQMESSLLEVVDDYGRTPAGKQAMMMLGDMYLSKGDFPKAMEQFKILAGKSRNHPMLYIAALHKLAETELASGDANAAAGTYLKAAADPSNIVSGDSRLRAAACFEHAGNFVEAEKLYKQVIDEEADPLIKEKSEERLLWLIANHRVSG